MQNLLPPSDLLGRVCPSSKQKSLRVQTFWQYQASWGSLCAHLCPRHCNDLCHRFWLKFGKASLGKDLHSVEMRLQHMLRCLLEQRYIYAHGEKVAQFTWQRISNFPTSWLLLLLRPASWCTRSTDLAPWA